MSSYKSRKPSRNKGIIKKKAIKTKTKNKYIIENGFSLEKEDLTPLDIKQELN